MGLSTLNGHTVTSARVTIPAWGLWFADVTLSEEQSLSGSATLKIADLTLSGTVLSGGPYKGRSRYTIIAGAGGWGRQIPSESYADDAGVKAQTVLGDAARAAGEQLDTSSLSASIRFGPRYVRPEGAASRVLEIYAPGAWYVDEAGVTRLGKRAASALPPKATVGPIDKARRTVAIASDEIAAILPGLVVDGIEAVDVVHDVSPEGVRSTVWGKANAIESSRLAETVRVLMDQLDPHRRFRGVTEYRVVTQDGEYLNLQPVLSSLGMPDLPRVPMRPGVSGCRSDVMLGSLVLVSFVNADPSRPYVSAFAGSDGEGFTPLLTEIDASTLVKLGAGALPVARATDLAGGIWPIATTQTKVVA